MRNLKLYLNSKYSLQNNCQHLAISYFNYNKNIFHREGDNFVYKEGSIFTVNPRDGACKVLLSSDQLEIENTKAVALFYNPVLNTLNIALEVGDVLSLSLDQESNQSNNTEVVVSIATGLQSAALSPDAETAVFITGDNCIMVMSGNFDPIGETNLFGSDQGEQTMVNVGWGKKETQFHGSEGKSAAKKATVEGQYQDSNADEPNKAPTITWRGDSSRFAVNYWCPEKKHRKIKIFDKCGSLQCTSEFIPGLGGVIAWRPSGNLIALTQNLPNKQVVCFMEKNGLRHGEFTLPPNLKVFNLSWNNESTILSAVCTDELLDKPCVLFWTMGNYHWYLKQKLVFQSSVVSLQWDDVIGNLAHILLADGTFYIYQWVWSVDHSAGIATVDLAAVAVIDGCDIKLSAFKKCVIPPPMCSGTVTLPCSALEVAFAPHCGINTEGDSKLSPNDLIVYLSDGRLGIINGLETTLRLQSVIPVVWGSEVTVEANSVSHWTWISHDKLVCTAHCDNTGTYLCLVQLSEEAATVISKVAVDEPVVTVSQISGTTSALVQLCTGDLLTIEPDGNMTPHSTLPDPCVSVRCIGTHIFARDQNNQMFVDGECVATNVTSYYCLLQFLVMTLSSHQLCITNINSGFKMLDGSDTCRRVERGARLVVCVSHSVVLQMPRGNLETIEPRALTLVTAAALLDSGDYAAVAKLLRRQRINLNLCVDHNPSLFLLSVPRFVAQIQDPQWLSVFVAELSDQDITHTMYKDFYTNQTGRGPPMADKVTRVCSALREAMSQTDKDRERYEQPILSSLVREGCLAEAIAAADSDQALNYLALLVDTDRLYDAALGAYNLDKALKIAGKTLKDPKEYVPYLNELRSMDPPFMRFTIDKRLRKTKSALRNLAQCADKGEECLQYVQETGLYNLGLQLFKNQTQMYEKICLLYGEWLLKHCSKTQAGLMLSRGGDIAGALAVYSKGGYWRQCLTLATRHGYSDVQLTEMSESMYSALVSSEQHAEAALLCEHQQW
ncbi:elongator complex protein 1 isoform X2 [Macrosteles quadrilineatus]|uniref:elongator complex protein 1 isoform X2 n=1 Tax=Macrosteles quadrilineatus TaxID=74068 RepID=UPI0023E252DA|nr:elongator complex protein 1 isoform X2 [Macrosteles quadrilineatus]